MGRKANPLTQVNAIKNNENRCRLYQLWCAKDRPASIDFIKCAKANGYSYSLYKLESEIESFKDAYIMSTKAQFIGDLSKLK
ncbi:hypothetical protein [Vibrio sp. ER1A]|uniref:hypothetical protein n=1 Tax=Vibrio sp. ER1A TaxID=1517681 RepID=UPI0004DD3404|nr:hypothetical protein [Vibrio sp. ER1A]KFA99239.1 hypothetical protein HW45_05015 [Vibrio sp. ER1A]